MKKMSWLKSGLVVTWPVTMDGWLGLYNNILKCGTKLKDSTHNEGKQGLCFLPTCP